MHMAAPASVLAALEEPEYRVEGPLKVTGRARYTADVQLPGLLWAKFLLSPHAHARIVSVDTTAARAIPGVHAVLTGQDVGPKLFGRVLYDWPVLAFDRVRYPGERVAAVAAETREAAEEAISLINVEYQELPAVFDAEEALGEDAPILHPEAASYFSSARRPTVPHLNCQGYDSYQKGEKDLQPIFARAHLVVEDVYVGPRQHQGYIEPHACAVWIQPDGKVRVYSTSKGPYGLRDAMARVIGIPAQDIIIDSMFIGGDFGGKGHSIDEFPCYYLAKATGRPVRSVMSYTEELLSCAPQHGAKYYLRTAVDRDGRILAHESRAYLNGGAYGGGRPNVQTTAKGGLDTMDVYNIPNARLESFFVYSNQVPSGNMRAPGAFHRGHAGEGHMDHIARELGLDPLDLRLRNVLREGDTTILGGRIRNPKAVEVLETLRREVKWDSPLPPNHGRGLAVRHRHVGQGKAALLLRLLASGSVEMLTGTPDQGGGALTVARRVAAATLSIPPERIEVRYSSTDETPVDGGVGGSRTTHVLGRASIEGATLLREKLEELAAEVMGWPAGQVRIDSDRFVVGDGSGESAPFVDVVARIAQGGPVEALGAYDAAEHPHEEEGGDYNFYAYAVQVAVDPDTGRIETKDVVAVADVGTIINPIAHQGQLDGGFIYGLGNTLMEELVIEEGAVTNPSLADYKLPTQMDVPPFRSVLIPTDIGPGPFGAKAAGELTNTGVGGAIANAISDAVGVQINQAPITAERVYEALLARRSGRG
jgi:carbon-monoxide dehydrogenase large subunit